MSKRDEERKRRLQLDRTLKGEKRIKVGGDGDFGYGPGHCLFEGGTVVARLYVFDNEHIRISVYGTDDFAMERRYFPQQRELAEEAWELIGDSVTIADLQELGFWVD